MKDTIIIAEDDLELSGNIETFLTEKGYECHAFADPVEALETIRSIKPALLISDLKMPHMDGIELSSATLTESPDTRILIVTAYSTMPTVLKALRLGVDNYILKPFRVEELLFQVQRALEKRRLILTNRWYREGLEQMVEEQTRELRDRKRELQISQIESIFAIGNIIEARDAYTRGHTERVTLYAVALAEAIGLTEKQISDIALGAPLHDIGKIAVADSILKKDGPLTNEEYEAMKDHAEMGYKLIRGLDFPSGTTASILYHHERYDGKGYPFGLKGLDIPVEGRIMAICDAFDAMTSNRVYRRAMTKEKALQIVESNSGSQFDPDLAAIFVDQVKSGRFDEAFEDPEVTGIFGELISNLIEI